jgi:hypothetical protein
VNGAASKREGSTGIREHLRDPNYYRLGYQLAAQQIHARGSDHAEKKPELPIPAEILYDDLPPERVLAGEGRPAATGDNARGFAEDLRYTAGHTRAEIEREKPPPWQFWRGPNQRDARLSRFLDRTVIPCLELVIADALRAEGDVAAAESRAKPLRAEADELDGDLSYRALYNLACYEAGDKTDRENAVRYLGRALRLAPADRQRELANWARQDPSLVHLHRREDFRELLDRFGDPKPSRKARKSSPC